MASTLRRNPPFRAEHVGSLKRPDDLLIKRKELHNGRTKQEELIKSKDNAIRDVVEEQINLGFHAISDGEHRRHSTS